MESEWAVVGAACRDKREGVKGMGVRTGEVTGRAGTREPRPPPQPTGWRFTLRPGGESEPCVFAPCVFDDCNYQPQEERSICLWAMRWTEL